MERVLEPEVMDSPAEALEYDSMDHRQVNRVFCEDLLAVCPQPGDVLDLGAGTAQIPIQLCRLCEDCRVLALDAAVSMLELARYNVEAAGQIQRIQLAHGDAKALPYEDGMFDTVISNSILHHIPEPRSVLREAVRVCRPGGRLFFRDLFRPGDAAELTRLVETYAGGESEPARQMFAASLHAALSLAEIRGLVAELGLPAETVQPTSDRHWTWSALRPE